MTRILVLAGLIAAIAVPAGTQAATTAQTVRVTERSYGIRLSARPKAGVVKFIIRNASSDPHDFALRGGGKVRRTRVIAPGGRAVLRVRLKRGVRYSFWCGVGSHADKGMSGSFIAR